MASITDLIEMYDPDQDTWSLVGRCPTNRGDVNGASYNGRIYVTGGEYETTKIKESFWAFESYRPSSQPWETLPHIQIAVMASLPGLSATHYMSSVEASNLTVCRVFIRLRQLTKRAAWTYKSMGQSLSLIAQGRHVNMLHASCVGIVWGHWPSAADSHLLKHGRFWAEGGCGDELCRRSRKRCHTRERSRSANFRFANAVLGFSDRRCRTEDDAIIRKSPLAIRIQNNQGRRLTTCLPRLDSVRLPHCLWK